MSKELSAKMGQSYKAAERLIRTETSHFHGEADKAAYEAAGIEEYEYVATLDARTCAVCGALDGKHFRVEDAQAGVNYPPMHPNDRCTTVEYDPNDAMDWYNSGKPMPKNMTYEEWYQLQVEEHGSGYVEMERKRPIMQRLTGRPGKNTRSFLERTRLQARQNSRTSNTAIQICTGCISWTTSAAAGWHRALPRNFLGRKMPAQNRINF